MSERLGNFNHASADLPVLYMETMEVREGVVCDVYFFEGDSSRDLGIVTVDKGIKTPLQRVLGGDVTIEGYVSGKAKLRITNVDGSTNTYNFPNQEGLTEVPVWKGQQMQWEADADTNLVFYELCYPPYAPGRYEDLPE